MKKAGSIRVCSGLVIIGLALGLSACSQTGTNVADALNNVKFPNPFARPVPVQQQPVVQSGAVIANPQLTVPSPLLTTPSQVRAPIQISPLQPQASLTSPTYTFPTQIQRNGKPKVALLLPTGGSGELGRVARQMRNAALLARDDAGSLIDLNFYDTQTNGGSTSTVASKAMNEGSELILGPLMGANVGQVAAQAGQRGVNLIGFSNDLSQARPGAYLLGIAPDMAVQQIVAFAGQRGIRRIAVMAPRSSYGTRAFAAAQDTAFQSGIQLVGPFSYDARSGSDERKTAAKTLSEQSDNFDAILIADNAQSSREMAALLVFNQVDLAVKRMLGTNLWIDPVTQQEAGMRGAWFAAAPEHNWKAFQSRYSSRFGEQPEKVAGLAYDAATLASKLVSQGQAYDANTLTSPNGFDGLFGSYRLSPTGHPIRSMDILEIRSGGTTVLQPASGFARFGS